MRWEPFAELNELRHRLDRMAGDLMDDGGERTWRLSIDVERDDGNLVVRADVPGVKPEDVNIEVQDDVLTVSAEHSESREQKEKHFLRRERRYGSFTRSIALPPGVDPQQIKAVTRNGVVEITVPLPGEAKREPIKITPTTA
jgi:HSP20 family protein